MEDLRAKNITNEDQEEKKCAWPRCQVQSKMIVNIPVLKQTPEGVIPLKDVTAPFGLCQYHAFLASSGLSQAIQDKDNKNKYAIFAPFDQIGVTEGVIAAMVLSGQFENLLTAKNKNTKRMDMLDRKAEEIARQNETKSINPKPEAS